MGKIWRQTERITWECSLVSALISNYGENHSVVYRKCWSHMAAERKERESENIAAIVGWENIILLAFEFN